MSLVSEAAATRGALASAPRPAPAGAASACAAFGWRALVKVRQVPEQLIDVTVGPVVGLLLFTYLFGGAIGGSTDAYLQFLLPAIIVQAVLFTAVTSGTTLSADRAAGGVVLGVGFVLGYEADGGVLGVLAGTGLVVGFAFALSWVFTAAGLIARSPTALQGTVMTALFVLVFLSNALVEPETLPRLLELLVGLNPVSHLITAIRGLFGGDGDAADIALVAGEALALIAVFAPLTAKLYGSPR